MNRTLTDLANEAHKLMHDTNHVQQAGIYIKAANGQTIHYAGGRMSIAQARHLVGWDTVQRYGCVVEFHGEDNFCTLLPLIVY